MCRLGWTGQNFDRSKGFLTTTRSTSACASFRWHRGIGECGRIRHWNKKQKAQATRGAVIVLAALWTDRRDTQKVDICSSQLRRAIILQPWDCAVDYYEVLALLREWQAPTKQRRDPNPKRTTALAHTLPWLDDEHLYHLCAAGIASWKEQDYADDLKKEPAPWNCASGGTVRREEQENNLTQLPLSPLLPSRLPSVFAVHKWHESHRKKSHRNRAPMF